jgi:hypothetical protein
LTGVLYLTSLYVPVGGYEKYNEYIANNKKEIDDDNNTIQKGEVILFFDVSDEGRPENIKVKHSLCEPCDREAIRLLENGPKWKTKQGKKGRLAVKF